MKKGLIALFASLLLALFVVSPTSAHHRVRVLGVATSASELVFPPVTSGPGFILPDSPLFFLDQFFQNIRLTVAFDSRQRAKVRAQIAGERLAELRLMLARNNPEGINTALSQLTKEVGFAAGNLTEAQAQGQNVETLAKDLNDTIKLQRHILGMLASQADGALKLQLKAARKALKEAKVEIEDGLDEAELEIEIEEDLNDEVEDEVEDAHDLAKEVERELEELEHEASQAAKKSLDKREEALLKAIEEKNEELKKAYEKTLEVEKKKQEALLKVKDEAAKQARRAIKEAKEAAVKFESARKATSEIKSSPVGGNSAGSSGSSNESENESQKKQEEKQREAEKKQQEQQAEEQKKQEEQQKENRSGSNSGEN